MKKSDFWIFAIFEIVYLIVACLAGAIFADLAVKAVNYFTEISYSVSAVIHAAVSGVVSVGLCTFLAYRDGYRYAAFSWACSLCAAGIATVIHFGVGLATRFAPIAFGPTRNIAGLVSFGEFFIGDRVPKISYGALAAVGVVMMMVYVVGFVFGNRLGCGKRLRDRAETVGESSAVQ